MKRHVSKTLLVMALTLSSVSSFVGCKDYDEDVYVDLKSRITKETSLREALQIQVNELEAYVKTLKSCECDLSEYLTKLQADKTYMKTSDYQAKIDQITANETAIALLQKAIDEINDKLRKLNLKDDRVDGIVNQISTMNELILQVQGLAQQALDAARDGKCTCDFTPLQNRIDHLEELIAGWGELITDVSKTANEALTTALKDSIWLVKQQKTIDSLINVINGMEKTVKETIIQRINTLENNTYTKEQIDKIIRELPIAEQVDVTPILERIKILENNTYTKQEVIDLIKAIPTTDLTSIERRLAALEGLPHVNAYTKYEVDELLRNLVIPQADLTPLLNRLQALEGKKFWTQEEIVQLITANLPAQYDHTSILNRLAALEALPHVDAYSKEDTYTKAQVDGLINALNIPAINDNIAAIQQALQNLPTSYLTEDDVMQIIQDNVTGYDDTEVRQLITNLQNALNDYAKLSDLSAYAKTSDLEAYAKTSDLTAYAKKTDLDFYAKKTDLNDYAKKSDVYTKAEIDAFFDALEIPDDLTDRVKAIEDLLDGKKFWTEDEIKQLIDDKLSGYYTKTEIDTKLAELANGYYDKAAVDGMIQDLQDAVDDAADLAQQALDLANDNKELIDALTEDLDDLKPRVSTLETTVGALETTVETLTSDVDGLKTRMQTAESNISDLQSRMGTAETNITNLQTAVSNLQTAVEELQTALNDLKDRVDDLEEAVEALDERVTDLEEDVEKLQNDIQKMITGVIVQGTQNPVVGYLNTPFDARTTLLGVYYGIPKSNWSFPSDNSADYARNVEFEMLERNWNRTSAILGDFVDKISGSAGQMIVTKDGDKGNAGTLYLTINPSNVDFTDAALKLADSQDKELDILSPLQPSDRILTMGYTRAAGNGFYEAAATITKNDVEKMKFEVNMENLQESVKGMFKNNSDVYSIVDFGANIIKSLQTELPAWAVKASWTDESKGTEHKLYSQYNIGAMAVKPLSLSFLQDVKLMNKAPLIEDLEDMVGEIMREINISITSDLPDFTKIAEAASKIEFTDFSLPTIKEDAFIVTVKKTIDLDEVETKIIEKYFGRDIRLDIGRNGVVYVAFDKNENEYVLEVEQTYTDGSKRYSIFRYDKATGKFYQDDNEIAQFKQVPLEFEVEVTVDKTEDAYEVLQQILDQVNAKVGASGSLSSQVTDLLNEVAEIGNLNDKISVSLGSSKENIKSVLDRYITKLNNKLTDYVNRSTSIMHLALIANNGNKVGILSQVKSNPTDATDFTSLELYPTTYNLELLAPVYKKFVAVSDVFNADGTEADISIAQTANNGENMAKIIDGDTRCTLKGQSGYIYEVMYTAVDYFGKVGLKKYYVKF